MSGRPDHVLYLWLLATAGQDDRDKAIVQTAALHRPFLDDWGQWVCERCSWCRPVALRVVGAAAPLGSQVHIPVSAYAPCEELLLLAWPYRGEVGYLPEWKPQDVEPTNPPTLLGGTPESVE